MKKSYDLEDRFRSLNQIPRSEMQKRKTLETILNSNRQKPFSSFFHNLSGVLLTIALSSGFAFILYEEILIPTMNESSSRSANQAAEDGKVESTYLTRSYSNEYYSLHSNLERKGIIFKKNNAWLKAVESSLRSMVPAETLPSGQADYDLLVVVDNREAIKCKVWLEDNDLYVKKINSGDYFQLTGKEASNIIDQLKGF